MPSRKGRPNKMSKDAKDNVAAVFNRLGGTHRMAQWAEENLTEFYKLYAKLIPVNASVTGNLKVEWPLQPSPREQ